MNTLPDAMRTRLFNEIAVPHIPIMYNFAYQMTRDHDGANDLVQDTFLRAYVFWDKFQLGTNIRGWLYCILKNTFINIRRSRSKEPLIYDYERIAETEDTDEPTTVMSKKVREEEIREIFDDDLVDKIESLPDQYKEVILLRDLQGWSYEEIARVSGCTPGAVRSRLHRARKILGKELLPYAREHGYISKNRKRFADYA